VKPIGASEIRQSPPPAADERPAFGARVRAAAAAFWLKLLFLAAQRVPWFARAAKGFFVWFAVRCSRVIRSNTRANARRIFGADAAPQRLDRFTRDVVGSFYDFVCDVGRSLHMTRQELVGRIERVEGREKYTAARALGRGAIILTAHMGSFEAGIAALLGQERRIHVVFKRDSGRFERIRRTLRHRLGVVEQPVDEGWEVWVRLRDALKANEVVAIQGDRVMPGQKGKRMPMCGGHVLLPTGPVKLATASGAPIIPVFSIRNDAGRIELFVEDAIIVGDDVDAALAQMARAIERYVLSYPQQWLVLHRAFCEDVDEPVEETKA
jgi:KDO2-lipid IV(A) lauroyltransferase